VHKALRQRLSNYSLLGVLLSFAIPGMAQELPDDFTQLSLEELMNIKVSLVSRKFERLMEAPAAVYALTGEDIRRSGATSLAEVLRLVPGLQVARIDANKWAVSARGFNNRFANKLLVLIDGRTVYTPAFSGVYWEAQDLLLEDVDRIEVIHGSGATLWGANAVNGIINIVTKQAGDTQGVLALGGGGTEERGFGGARYGARLANGMDYRIFAKYFNRGQLVDTQGRGTDDGWSVVRGGGRLDWETEDGAALTLQGDLFTSVIDQVFTFPALEPPYERIVADDTEFFGGDVVGHYKRKDLALQVYFDWTDRWIKI